MLSLVTVGAALALAFVVALAVWRFRRRKQSPVKRVLIVVGQPTFEVPCAANAVAIFRRAGLTPALVTLSGGRVDPDKHSLEGTASKAAEQRSDAAWFAVLQNATKTTPLSSCVASRTAAVFVAGGASALKGLRQTDFTGSSPTPFCLALRAFCADVLKAGGVVGATGHGVHGLPEDEHARGRFAGSLDSAATSIARAMVATMEDSKIA